MFAAEYHSFYLFRGKTECVCQCKVSALRLIRKTWNRIGNHALILFTHMHPVLMNPFKTIILKISSSAVFCSSTEAGLFDLFKTVFKSSAHMQSLQC